VTVDYATADGTATAPADYTAAANTLTFAPGVTNLPVSVPVVGDTLDELDETFTVNLSNAANATITDAQGLGTITDDDIPTVQFSGAPYSIVENGGSATITVALSAISVVP
jgi:hypothetical protein